MIAHVVLFTPKRTLASAERQALGAAFSAAIKQIPSVRRARIGRRVTHGRPYEQLMVIDYSHAAVIEFDDLSGLKAYLNDPAHDRLAAVFFASFEHALMYDFDLDEGDRALEMLVNDEKT
jgi:stress responsive alpha/beta barrel protein